MKNLEKIGSVSEDNAIADEMEVLVPIAPSKEKEACAIENGVTIPIAAKEKKDENGSNKADIKVMKEKDVAEDISSESSESSESKDINGKTSESVSASNNEECNGEATKATLLAESEKIELVAETFNGDINGEDSAVDKQVKEQSEDLIDSSTIETAEPEAQISSPNNVENAQADVNQIESKKEEVFKMPNTIEELLDEEVLKDDSSGVPELDLDEVFTETDIVKKTDEAEEMETEYSKPTEELVKADQNQVDHLKSDLTNKKSGVDEAMEVVDAEKLSEEKVEVDSESKDPNVINPFVDETSPESDEDAVKDAEKKNDEKSEKDNPSQISLESVDQVGSEEDNSDDDLDINAGLDKCFSALEKEISKDEAPIAPKSVAVLEDNSSRDVSNVPSEAEEGGNEADDEGDRMCEPVVPEEPVDLDQALGELEMIEKTTRRILDDDSESLKRPSEEPTEPVCKKVKIDESLEETVEVVKKKKLKKGLKKMSRNDLEDLIANKMVEVMTNKSEIGKLRHQCDSFQESVEKWKRRAQALSKQCTDLSTVMRKYITDSKSRPRDKVAPVRITRSVGLQVMTPDQRRLQQQRQNMNRNRAQDKAVAPGAVQKSAPAKTPVSNGSVKHNNGLANTTAPQLPRTVGGTTISPAKSVTPLRNTGSVTITQTKTPSTSTTPKPVIDIVDLSDDESTPAPPPPKPAPQPVRQGPSSMVRSSGPRQQGQQFIMQGNQLYPVRQQGMARQNMQGNRPMMGSRPRAQMRSVHPAPLPPMPNPQPNSPNWKLLPPRPALKISKVNNGIVLSWNMNLNLATHATIASYQLYAYQESAMQRPDPSLWKKVGDVKALPLPMACTLTQFTRGNKYHFAVRAMDGHSRVGQFSDPNSIVLN